MTMNLPVKHEEFISLTRWDLLDKPMNDIHIEIYPDTSGIGFFCYGQGVHFPFEKICFGHSKTLEGAFDIIAGLEPYHENGTCGCFVVVS